MSNDTEYYRYWNENPKNHKTGDCVIRALSSVYDMTWDGVIDALVPYAHKYKQMIDCPECYGKFLKDNHYIKVNQPKKPSNNKKYTGKEVLRIIGRLDFKHPVFTSIGTHHVTAMVKCEDTQTFKIHDIWDPSENKVGMMWIHEDDVEKWYHADREYLARI